MFEFLKPKKTSVEVKQKTETTEVKVKKEKDKKDNLALVVLPNYKERAEEVNKEIGKLRGEKNKNYIVPVASVKFSNGEGKVKLEDSVRGKDVYILSDVSNYSITYNMYGFENHMSPDEHFQDIIRTISAIAGKANKITVIMPLLYSSRQHRRQGRESLDSAMALRELENLGVDSVITCLGNSAS